MASPVVFSAATVTVSDRVSDGRADDVSGPLLATLLAEAGADVMELHAVPDDPDRLTALLIALAARVDVVITTGGTGLAPRDLTPEATAAAVERRVSGIEEALHRAGVDKVPTAILSRAVAGVRGRCFIANLAGSPGGVRDGMKVLAPVLAHCVRLVRGEVTDCRDDLAGHTPPERHPS